MLIARSGRIAAAAAAGALILLLAPADALGVRVPVPADVLDTVAPGDLTVAPSVQGEWHVGALTVTISESDGLVVESAGRTVWASVPGRAFVAGGRGEVSWEEHRGYFWPSVIYADRLGEQSVDEARLADDSLTLTGRLAAAAGAAEEASYTLTVRGRPADGAALDLTTSADTPLTSVVLATGRTAEAGVHGFGEQFADFDLDGRLLPIVVREQGVGRGEQPLSQLADVTNHGAGGTDAMTYAAWPSFLTEDLRGLRLAADDPTSSAFAVADTRDPEAVALELWATSLSAQVSAADDPAALVAAQQAGDRRAALAAWPMRGAIIGLQGGTAEVRRELGRLERAGTKVSAVWLQDWTGSRITSFGSRLWWTWQLDRELYPRWERLVADLRDRGIRTTTYVSPWLVDASKRGRPGLRNLWAEARDAGYLVRTQTGKPYLVDQGGFAASLVDLTDPAARSWYARVIAREVLAGDVAGFMADFGEGLPMDARLHAGSASVLHNRWPGLWSRTVRIACQRAGKPECVTWFRSGSAGQAADAALFWNGDQLVTFGREDGLASALLGALSAGVSGWPLVHSDIGGYTSVNAFVRDYVRTPELLARWAEYEAFGVVMRTHEGNRPDDNTQVFDTPGTARRFARMTQLYAALAPYRRTVVAEALRTGVPAIRAGWLVVPGTAAAEVDDQFFLGEHVLVAPVLQEGAESVEVTFPPGRWVHLLTGAEYAGDADVTVPAPLGTPAAFVRVDGPWTARLRTALSALSTEAGRP